MKTRWSLRPAPPEAVRRLTREGRLSEVVARVLAGRGHSQPELALPHLEARLSSLHDPELLPGLREAAQRLARAVQDRERILVHGDYDVDGVTGTALLLRLFRLIGADAIGHIPNRLTDGYSFGPHSVERALSAEASVVVSVDNGTSAIETITELKSHGIDTVVTDHHEPPPSGLLPPTAALVNAKLPGSTYPFRELCGSGVAFKLAWGVCQEVSGARRVREDLRLFLMDAMAYVAMATVCDVVPLVDENRVLARRGLLALEQTAHPGLRALLKVCGLAGQPLNAEDVGFKLGPRINAAGRLGSASRALDLLLCEDPAEARRLATLLDELNGERKRIEASICTLAFEQAERFDDAALHPVLVLAGQGWHQGVVGIVAARVAERFGRPALVIGLEGDEGRGSARSVPGFDVLAAMHGGARHMQRYGGHEQAAGCELLSTQVEPLREAIAAHVRETHGAAPAREPELLVDGELPLAEVTDALMRQLDRLEPFGERNPKPRFLSLDARLAEPARAVGDGSHLMLKLRQGERVLKAMAFGMGSRLAELTMGAPLHVVYTPRWNTFRGETRLELELHDFRLGERPRLEPGG